MIGDVDSLGIRWLLVEIETPRSGIYLSDKISLDKFARKGTDQVIEWRHWIANNIAYAHKPRRENGLGLYDINGQAEALVLVGRRASFPVGAKDSKRRALRESDRLHLHTYDWLLQRLRGAVSHTGPPASNPFLFHKAVEDYRR